MYDWLRQVQEGNDEGLVGHLYHLASVPPSEVLATLRQEGVTVYAPEHVLEVPTERLDPIADKIIRKALWRGTFYGATFGMGGLLSVPPELAYLFLTIVRLAQRISLCYGQEYESLRGQIELWSTLGRGVGIELDIEGLETDVYRRLPVVFGKGPFRDPLLIKAAQKVLVTIGFRVSSRVARFVPFLGAGVGLASTYAYLAGIGKRMKEDCRTRHQLQQTKLNDSGVSEEISYTMEPGRY